MQLDPLFLYAAAAAVYFIGGTVKGTIGMGLPATALALMTLLIDPRSAIALVLMPMLFSNLWQMYRGGHILRTIGRYWYFGAALGLGVWVTIYLSAAIDGYTLIPILGAAIILFVILEWINFRIFISDKYDTSAQLILGTMAGIIGGLTAVWATPMAQYLTARHIGKDEFIRASGFLIVCGSIPLAAGYVQAGMADVKTFTLSTALLVPTLMGFSLGEALRGRLSEAAFRNIVLGVYLVLGLNLIRRGFF